VTCCEHATRVHMQTCGGGGLVDTPGPGLWALSKCDRPSMHTKHHKCPINTRRCLCPSPSTHLGQSNTNRERNTEQARERNGGEEESGEREGQIKNTAPFGGALQSTHPHLLKRSPPPSSSSSPHLLQTAP
jgi:hypothetical protein